MSNNASEGRMDEPQANIAKQAELYNGIDWEPFYQFQIGNLDFKDAVDQQSEIISNHFRRQL